MIRPARREDGKDIATITSAAGSFTAEEKECAAELWASYLERGADSGYEFIVHGAEDGRVAGYACFGPHPLTEGTYDLYWIAVLPEARGRGIGRALLARVEEEVRARKGRLLVIETSDGPSYAEARRLYSSSGCSPQATISDFYAPGDSLVIYVKPLA